MAEVLVKFVTPLRDRAGQLYWVQACGRCCDNGMWEGWLEFKAEDGSALRSGRETEQPNRRDLVYWAEGLTATYIEGALERAQRLDAGPPIIRAASNAAPEFDRPAMDRPVTRIAAVEPSAVMNPFAVWREGEGVLRRQLGALSRDHLRAIALAYGFTDASPASIAEAGSSAEIIDHIVRSVRRDMRSAHDGGDELRA